MLEEVHVREALAHRVVQGVLTRSAPSIAERVPEAKSTRIVSVRT
jgi:hypothetical protein